MRHHCPGKIRFCQLEHHRTQQQQGQQIRQRHQGIQGIRHQPDEVELLLGHRPHRDHQYPEDAERGDRLHPEQILGALLAIETPPQQGGEGEYRQTEGHHIAAESGQGPLEGHGGEGRAGLAAGPGAGHHDRQTGDGADDQGVDEGAEHGDAALPHRTVGSRRGMGDGGAAQTRLVGKDAPRHPETDRRPDRRPGKSPGGRSRGKGVMHDMHDGARNRRDVEQQHQQAAQHDRRSP